MKYDVIVCGAGPSGMVAAISLKRMNVNVLLIEASGILGGSSTLSFVTPWMTFHNDGVQIIKGIGEEIVSKLIQKNYSLGHIKDPIDFCDTITPVDVEGIKEVYFDYIRDEKIDLLLHATVCDVIKDGSTIKGIKAVTKSGIIDLYSDVVVDATGDGDVCKLMGCDFIYGSSKDHLPQPMTMMFTVGNIDFQKIKEYILENPNDFVLNKNQDYKYIGLSGFFSKVKEAKENHDFDMIRDRVLLFQNVKKDQATINMTRIQNLSSIDAFELSKAEVEGRLQIKKAFSFLKKYIPGFENSEIVSTPSMIGVRESRHIIGEYILEVEDILNLKTFDDSICLSAFPIDIHASIGDSLRLFKQRKDKCYEIPIRVLIPRNVNNLVVTGRCVSATHETCASLRVTPSVMGLGQAAGVLAALASKQKKTPREIDFHEVQEILIKQGQIIKR